MGICQQDKQEFFKPLGAVFTHARNFDSSCSLERGLYFVYFRSRWNYFKLFLQQSREIRNRSSSWWFCWTEQVVQLQLKLNFNFFNFTVFAYHRKIMQKHQSNSQHANRKSRREGVRPPWKCLLWIDWNISLINGCSRSAYIVFKVFLTW